MTATTTSGSGTVAALVNSAGININLPANVSTSLLQSGAVTVTGSGHSALFLGEFDPGPMSSVVVSIVVDGNPVYSNVNGQPFTFRMVLSAGSHTIDYVGVSSGSPQTMPTANLTVLDLGI